MDKLQQLYDLMLEQGLLTSDISLEQFRSADDSQKDALYNLSLNEGIITPDVVSNADFKAAWSDSAQRISDFNEDLKESKENVVELQRQEKERVTARDMARPEAVVETTAGVAVAPPIVEAQPKSVGQKISEDVIASLAQKKSEKKTRALTASDFNEVLVQVVLMYWNIF